MSFRKSGDETAGNIVTLWVKSTSSAVRSYLKPYTLNLIPWAYYLASPDTSLALMPEKNR